MGNGFVSQYHGDDWSLQDKKELSLLEKLRRKRAIDEARAREEVIQIDARIKKLREKKVSNWSRKLEEKRRARATA